MRYKIELENNVPVKATLANSNPGSGNLTVFGQDNKKTIIKSFSIEAHTEADALEIAHNVVKSVWGDI